MGCAGSKSNDAVDTRGGGDGNPDEEDEYQPLTKEEVQQRIQASDGTLVYELGKTGVTMHYAYLSQRGYYPEDLYKANQDAFKVVPAFNGDQNQFFMGVFDGHGVDGDACSYFVRDNIEEMLKKMMAKYPDDFDRAYKEAFVNINIAMHQEKFDDSMSGTTAIAAFFKGREMTVANIGDSRAVVGEKKKNRVIAYSLSVDQTPYRMDERERVKAAGAVVMSCDQLEGIVPYHENWGVNLGEELDNGGDPPRVWAPGKTFPGCAFTRSIGDSIAESIGVTAEPEVLCKELTADDEFVVIASDGVWEFLTNQSVADMIMKFDDPLEACRSVVAEAYRLWLQYEVRTDDITMVLAFLESQGGDGAVSVSRGDRRRESRRGSASEIALGGGVVMQGESRPVRRGLSKEKRQALAINASSVEADDGDDFYEAEVVPKSADEVKRIRAAVKANFLFQHLNEAQLLKIFDVMKRVPVSKSEVVIRQGDQGDWFYVVEEGEYVVTIAPPDGGAAMEILKYTTAGGTNPCFGELALMYSKPRAATVTAATNGSLWAMDRRSFRSILMKSSTSSTIRTLRSVDVLQSLTVGQLQRLSDVLTEVSFKDGEYVVTQGETSSTFYIIADGKVRCTKSDKPGGPETELMELGKGQYFGERALLKHEPRAANVIAVGRLKCLYISKDAFEEVLGSLQSILDEDRKWREKLAMSKQLQLEAEGLHNVSFGDFTTSGAAAAAAATMLAVSHKGKEYTIKAVSKKFVADSTMQSRVLNEKKILAQVTSVNAFVPLALQMMVDANYLYTVFKARIAMQLDVLMESGTFEESAAKFYTASCALAIAHLQSEGIVYRHLCPDGIMVDSDGHLQLMDMRYAVKLDIDDLPRDFCGAAYYLSPEQVASKGHDFAVDYWALGILTYEMLVGHAPWLTGDETKDSEIAIFSKISSHTTGAITLPVDLGLSGQCESIINALLEPNPIKRLGMRGVGAEEVKVQGWFTGFDWSGLAAKTLESPHASIASATMTKLGSATLADVYSGDDDWAKEFSSFAAGKA